MEVAPINASASQRISFFDLVEEVLDRCSTACEDRCSTLDVGVDDEPLELTLGSAAPGVPRLYPATTGE